MFYMKVKIEKLNINGEGVCLLDNKKVCVKKVLPNELVEIEKVNDKQNFILGKLKNVLEQSPLRVKENCKFVRECGGCDFMFVDSINAINIKKQVITEYFKDIYNGKIIANFGKNCFYYRNKVAFAVNDGEIGLNRRGSKDLVEITNCMVAKPDINVVLQDLKKYIIFSKDKFIHHLVVRSVARHISIVIVSPQKPQKVEFLINLLNKNFCEKFGLFWCNNRRNSKEILNEKIEKIFGEDKIEYSFLNKKFYVKPLSFMQINEEMQEKLYLRVIKEIEDEKVIEGYSGTGILSVLMSSKAKSVVSIEINKSAHEDAILSKKFNNICNLTFVNGDCSEELLKYGDKNCVFVIDPPRRGVDVRVLDSLKQKMPKKIVYISCNPYTLKQNIAYLKDEYKIAKFEIFDIFPQTFEIESFVVLEAK